MLEQAVPVQYGECRAAPKRAPPGLGWVGGSVWLQRRGHHRTECGRLRSPHIQALRSKDADMFLAPIPAAGGLTWLECEGEILQMMLEKVLGHIIRNLCSLWQINCPSIIGTKDKITSTVTQMVRSPRAMWETQVGSLGWEDPLEEKMATHSSILAWKIPWTEEPGRLQSMGSRRVSHNWVTSLSLTQLGFPGGSVVKNRLPVQETGIQSSGQEEPPQEEMVAHSSILASEIPRTEEPFSYNSWGCKRVRYDLVTKQQQQQ